MAVVVGCGDAVGVTTADAECDGSGWTSRRQPALIVHLPPTHIWFQSSLGVSALTSHSKPISLRRGSRSFFILPLICRCLITQMPSAMPVSVMYVLRTRVWPHCALNLVNSSKFWSQRSS